VAMKRMNAGAVGADVIGEILDGVPRALVFGVMVGVAVRTVNLVVAESFVFNPAAVAVGKGRDGSSNVFEIAEVGWMMTLTDVASIKDLSWREERFRLAKFDFVVR
jgi:hypothetical protein